MRDPLLRRLGAAALVAAAMLVTAGSAGAVDESKPSPMPCGPSYKDADSDAVHPLTGATSDSLEIRNVFFKHEPVKGAEATTVNLLVKDLSLTLPEGQTSMHWTFEWTTGDTTSFVRAVVDYTGAIAYEYGERIPETAAGNLPRYEYGGDTQGAVFEGPDGVVQIVLPTELGGSAGSELKAWIASSNAGYQVVPVAVKSPTRGVSYAWDEATGRTWTVGACPEGEPPAEPAPAVPGPGGEASSPPALGVKVAKRARRSGRRVAVRITASEPLTRLTARLVRGRKVVAKGGMAKLSGRATLRLKAVRKLRRGAYRLELAATDAAGRRVKGSARLKVR